MTIVELSGSPLSNGSSSSGGTLSVAEHPRIKEISNFNGALPDVIFSLDNDGIPEMTPLYLRHIHEDSVYYSSIADACFISFNNDADGTPTPNNAGNISRLAHGRSLRNFINDGNALFGGTSSSSGSSSSASEIIYSADAENKTLTQGAANEINFGTTAIIDTYTSHDTTSGTWIAPKDMTILISANARTEFDDGNRTSSVYLYIKNSSDGILGEQADTKNDISSGAHRLNATALCEVKKDEKIFVDIRFYGQANKSFNTNLVICELNAGSSTTANASSSSFDDFSEQFILNNTNEVNSYHTDNDNSPFSLKINEIEFYYISSTSEYIKYEALISDFETGTIFFANDPFGKVISTLNINEETKSKIKNLDHYKQHINI
jgi:hypothetical protein